MALHPQKAKNFSEGKTNSAAFKSNQITFIGLRNSKGYYKRPGEVAEVYGKGHFGVNLFCGSMCAEEMGYARRWVRWVLRGTGTASGHPGVS